MSLVLEHVRKEPAVWLQAGAENALPCVKYSDKNTCISAIWNCAS